MEDHNSVSLGRALEIIGLVWAGIGFTIVVVSNVILIGDLNVSIWFIPINPRDNILTAFLLLAPAALILIGFMIKKKKFSRN